MSHRSVRIRVSGKVQGVFFRQSTQQQAQALGLTGFVQNEPDGTVLVQAHGPAHAVTALVDWCRQGPPAARVAAVDVTELPADAPGTAAGFAIRR